MSLVYAGKLALSAIMPSSLAAVGAASSGLTGALPTIGDDLAGATTLAAQVLTTPPNLVADKATAVAIAAGLAAAVVLSVPLADIQAPELTAQAAALAPIVAGLASAQAAVAPLAALFKDAGVLPWSFSGTGLQLGPLLTGRLANGMPDGAPRRAPVTGFVLASTGGGTWTGLQSFFPSIPGSQPAGSLVDVPPQTIGSLAAPLAAGLTSAGTSVGAQLGSLGARLGGVNAALSGLSPTLLGNVATAGKIVTALTSPPSYITPSVALAAANGLVTSLTAAQTRLTADVAAMASLTTSLGTTGVLAFTYSGPAEDLGTALSAQLGSGWPDGTPAASASNALVLLVSGAGTAQALASLFGGL